MNLIEKIKQASTECKTAYNNLYEEIKEDLKFTAGGKGQWLKDDINAITQSHKITLSINVIKKQIDTLLGRREQTLTDLRAYPIEDEDQTVSHIATRLLKWTLDTVSAHLPISQAYKNMLIGGLGFIFVENDKDGFIRYYSRSPLNVYIDPYCSDIFGLTDAEYVIAFKQVNREDLKKAFPSKKQEIDNIQDEKDELYKYSAQAQKRKSKVVVKEYWYRDSQDVTYIYNSEKPDTVVKFEGTKAELDVQLLNNPFLKVEEKTESIIKIAIVSGDTILQDEKFSDDGEYPIFPLIGYYFEAIEEWEYKIMGHVRNLKDMQREFNARHSSMMAVTQKTPLGAWTFEEGSIKDVDALRKAGGKVSAIQYRRGAQPPQLVPQQGLPASEIGMLGVFSNDLDKVGLPPEVTGAPANVDSAKGISLVQATGLTSVAELNSHLNFALRRMGLYTLKLANEQYPVDKMQKIIGNALPITEELYAQLKDLAFNIKVDETTYSPTAQLAAFESLISQIQHGVPVPPEALVKYNPNLPPEAKQDILGQMQMQAQMAQQMQAQAQPQTPQQMLPPPQGEMM